LNNPEYVKIGDKKYKINTDFRVALECQKIATDTTIGDYERTLAIIYKLFGDEGLDDKEHYNELLELAKKYLTCNKELETNEEPDMSFEQDYNLIEASFMSDYKIDLSKIKMHWWTFFNLLNGLSNSEMGNCCVLNRVRYIRNYDTKDLKGKELEQWLKLKKMYALKKEEPPITDKQKQSAEKFYKLTGIKRRED
jgi:hypothetical protein